MSASDSTPDPLRVAAHVTSILGQLGVSCSIGGSLASSLSGEPRSTLDVDIVVALEASHVAPLVSALEDAFYVNRDALERAVRTRSSANLIHVATSVKVDLFVAGGTVIDTDLLQRRLTVFVGDKPAIRVYVHSAEDILLQKLRWYRMAARPPTGSGGMSSASSACKATVSIASTWQGRRRGSRLPTS